MNLLDIVGRFFRNLERDRIDAKFDHFDERMDSLEQSNCEMKAKLDAIHQINFANNEALEQKLNASKSAQQQIIETMQFRFSYNEDSLREIKDLLLRRS